MGKLPLDSVTQLQHSYIACPADAVIKPPQYGSILSENHRLLDWGVGGTHSLPSPSPARLSNPLFFLSNGFLTYVLTPMEMVMCYILTQNFSIKLTKSKTRLRIKLAGTLQETSTQDDTFYLKIH